MTKNQLSNLLSKPQTSTNDKKSTKSAINKLQLQMLRIQQSIWHNKQRVIIVFEGFDAAGKGGAIRKITEVLDPRGIRVYPVGEPGQEEQSKHWLSRFWNMLPSPGMITVLDRSWYGRVLVERVENLTEKKNWRRAYNEIIQFEKYLVDDGIHLIKIFLAVSKGEQLIRFQDRLNDPYKQWKITEADIRAREKWDNYVSAVDEMLFKTNTSSPWHLLPADNKYESRLNCLKAVTYQLAPHQKWIEQEAKKLGKRDLKKSLKNLELKDSSHQIKK